MTATVKATSKKARKPQPLNGNLLPDTEGPALRFIALDVIDAHAQVRTEFDEDSLAELADDIKVRGLLQPVLLRPSTDGRYIIIAGERRIRAARIAGLPAVPAIVGDTSEQQADDMQLAENIQREDLSLADTARAVRKLYDREGKLDLVAAIVKKSKSWVSKHLAVTCPDFDWKARKLLEEGITDDLELLNTLSAIDKLDYHAAMGLDKAIRAGKAGRKEARAILAQAKKANEQRRADMKAAKKKEKQQGPKQPEPPKFNPNDEVWELRHTLRQQEHPAIAELVAKYTDQEQAEILATFDNQYQDGALVAHLEPIDKMRRLVNLNADGFDDDFDNVVFMMGAFGMELTLTSVLTELERAFQTSQQRDFN